MTNEDWVKVGIGAGGLVVGLIGGTLLAGSGAPTATGLSRLYGNKAARGHQVAVDILADSHGYLLSYEAPYGVVDKAGRRSDALESKLFSLMEEAAGFPNQEDAAAAADENLKQVGYKPQSDWTDTISWSLKT